MRPGLNYEAATTSATLAGNPLVGTLPIMHVAGESYPIYRFGSFEVDARSGELRKNGLRLKVQDQPFQVLVTLLERSGEIVTREELHSILWPSDTFVDFDTGLNTAIKRLREVLGDAAERPAYIETIPKRGYRFAAPVNGPRVAAVPVRPVSKWRKVRPVAMVSVGLLLAGCLGAWLVAIRLPLPAPRITGFSQITSDGLAKNTILTDGSRLYVDEILSDHMVVAQVSSMGGSTALIDASIPGLSLLDISSDGAELLVCKCKDTIAPTLWTIPVPAGSPRKIDVASYSAAWAPGGSLIFARGKDLFLAGHNGNHPRKLLTTPGFCGPVSFSPDGGWMRFNVYDEVKDTSSIWEARIDGTGLHPLLPGWRDPPRECCGRWTPDGKYFVFESVHEGAAEIWALAEQHPFWRRASREPVQITSGPTNFYSAVPSKDGKRLFVVGAQPKAELVRYDARAREYVRFLGGISAGDVEFSRDGTAVVYVKYPEGTLWRSKPDGKDPVQLTYPPLQAALAHWSPDGKRIAFSGNKEGQHWTIYQIAAEGGVPEQLSPGKTNEQDPTWSPDGNTLMFGQFQPSGDRWVTVIQSLDLKSRQLTQVPGSENVCCPRWSPDGRYVAACSVGQGKLFLFDTAARQWRELLRTAGDFGYFNWSRDSKYVFYDTIMVKEPEFSRVRVADSRVERLADLKELRRFWGNWGPWTGLGPDESPLMVRDISNQEIYALDWQL